MDMRLQGDPLPMAKSPRPNKQEMKMVRALDDLAEFERFQDSILPVLRKAIEENWTADKIWSHPTTQALLAAQAVRIGLNNADPGRALDAIKTVIYQTAGKPKEKQEITHKVERLKDEELDSLLATHLADLNLIDKESLN